MIYKKTQFWGRIYTPGSVRCEQEAITKTPLQHSREEASRAWPLWLAVPCWDVPSGAHPSEASWWGYRVWPREWRRHALQFFCTGQVLQLLRTYCSHVFLRARHGVGQCCVDIRAILQGHCPNIQTFCGLSLRESSRTMKSKQQVKKLLHEDYLANGGALGLSEWSKGHWRGRNLNMASGYFVAYVIWADRLDPEVKRNIINRTISSLIVSSQ